MIEEYVIILWNSKKTEKQYKDRKNTLCINTRLAVQLAEDQIATVAGALLFGRESSQFIVSAGIGIQEKTIKPILKLGHSDPEFIDNIHEFIVILRRK